MTRTSVRELTYGEHEDLAKARARRLAWVARARRDFPEVVVSTTGTDLYCTECGRAVLSHLAVCEAF